MIKWSQWVTSQWLYSIKSRPSVHLLLLRVGSEAGSFFSFNETRRLVCFGSYVFHVLHVSWRILICISGQRYSTVFSFLFRNQFGYKIKACDQQLVHYIGVDPESKHRRRADTDLTVLTGMSYSPQLCFVSSFCRVGSSLKASVSPNFLGLVSG